MAKKEKEQKENGTPAMLDEMILEEEYRRMLRENGFERD